MYIYKDTHLEKYLITAKWRKVPADKAIGNT